MRIVDSHFHWWPRSVFEAVCKRSGHPRAVRNARGGYTYWRKDGEAPIYDLGPEWFDLDAQLAHMDTLGFEVDVVCSIGPFAAHFSDIPPEEGREMAMMWNEEMAGAQRRHPDRLWASGAIPLSDPRIAVEVLEHAMGELDLIGVNMPGSVGDHGRIDDPALEPFYERAEALGATLFVHPTDTMFRDSLEGYDGALYLSLGRVIDVSVAAYRLVLSGIMERHPGLKIYMSHTGGALPYQSGRMDKNSRKANLPLPPSTYLKRMYTDTVSPHTAGIRFAVEYYGVDHVMYGSDYPCWTPATALELFHEIGLSIEDQEKILNLNARRVLNLKDRGATAGSRIAAA
ncbi:amidohydrolase family protein [Caulobacter sp. S45]|uniref:amidohydrolase family protein n=1 Tax=Caulobacter sp. S45 TaxID=1641861 RepID=UPI00131DA1D6|nr:amidohydrolase family protein [Caulobacter sp. S45]